ncbi:hypothetical protein [Microbacterium capsulatum]|uniref:HEAT repeat domain-containing protein n=1 Tax=Microbacterium capsulatum TaxID=3041921 RepID=A0ABU0XF52_9MICO|nr:hypothetical protein [Microbacterium sp. ASV81]MDQ4213744.1 hypothetical protein [Microbacterium sp. ASV81]
MQHVPEELPSLPYAGRPYLEYLQHCLPEELARIAVALAPLADRSDDVHDLLEGTILRVVDRQISPVNPEYGLTLLRTFASSADPQIRAMATSVMGGELGRGIDEAEQIAWDQLLRDPDEDVRRMTYEVLSELVDAYASPDDANRVRVGEATEKDALYIRLAIARTTFRPDE